MRRGIHWGAALVAVATIFTTVSAVPGAAEPRHGYAADIRYTEYGIPHITAKDFGGLGYGYGYAAATDNVCLLAKMYVTVNAQRSRYFGADTPSDFDYGPARTNLDSDLYFQQVNDSRIVDHLVAQQAPVGPRREVRDIIRGYAAGYNRFVREGRITDPACRGAEWVRPISEKDVYRHFYAVFTYAGAAQAMDSIATAAPATAATPAAAAAPADAVAKVREALEGRDMGSNAIAVGSDGTANGRGLLLGNPHFPWQGGRRFWQSQLTVPGRLDVSGGSLLGLPLVQIGFNKDVAWSHTVSTAATFGFYQVNLVPGDPTSYLVDGKAEKMTSRTVRVRVQDGTVERTLYSTRYGPVLADLFGIPGTGWTTTTAFAIRDANRDNLRGLNTWFGFGQARDTKGITDVLRGTQGVPWVNTIATDRSGHALFSDIQVVPHVTDELAATCSTPLGQQIFPAEGIPVLDGTRAECAWGTDRDAAVPGIFGPKRLPLLNRADYVENSNDSAWLSNPHQPITNYPRIVGDIGTQRGPRTRMGITAIEEGLGSFTRQAMQNLLFADRSWSGEQAAAAAAQLCASFPNGQAPTSSGGTVPVGNACTALSGWDRTMTVDSRGGLLFEQFWLKAGGTQGLWLVPFDPADPVATPNTLDTANPAVAQALGDAIAELRAAGVDPAAPLGENHYVVRNGTRIPVHGGNGAQGVLNAIQATWDPAAGDVEVVHGSSHIQAVSFTGGQCPDAATLLTYSQSANPSSAHFADQTALFSDSRWVRSRFCEKDIMAAPGLKVVRLRG
ncbi:penicillin acylase family protein [Actinophytocola oryzae]|uniref:Acyl-homoserine-lactone acylase n=1 Tax=Actinophytocola oryzae TaxID=502181 RepID=A0A4R7VF78_9PSEU|nr:penicillin acylase family protein [Actinophytocola oryzae]TDV47874.1 acyl-homoserine-lactone acylase [Actinophytocola oryzae]